MENKNICFDTYFILQNRVSEQLDVELHKKSDAMELKELKMSFFLQGVRVKRYSGTQISSRTRLRSYHQKLNHPLKMIKLYQLRVGFCLAMTV